MRYHLAIDFGTTNSVVAYRTLGQPEVEFVTLPDLSTPRSEDRPPLIPSLLYVQNGQTGDALLGQSVLDGSWHRQPGNRFFRSFKRSILAGVPAQPRLIDGVPWTDQDAGRCFLRGLLEAMPFQADEIEQLVVTAPVAAFEGYLAWLNEGLRGIAPEQIRLVDESTAAALGYSVTEPGAVLLVFDFGGGSLDVSLVQLPASREKTGGWLHTLVGKSARGHTARVIAKSGINLGGSDVDQWLLAYAAKRLALPADWPADSAASLLAACEQVKIELSLAYTAELSLPTGDDLPRLPIQRQELEQVLETNGYYAAIQHLLDKVMHVAQRQGIFREDIRYVLMVGGASLMPSVQQLLRSYFSAQAVRVDKPFTAIAEGALGLATGYGLDDYLLHSYGLRYLDPVSDQHAFEEIIPMGSRYPSPKPVEVGLAAAYADQTQLELVIGEVDNESVSGIDVRYEDGQPVFLASACLDSQQVVLLNAANPPIVTLSPAGTPGAERLRVSFRVDEQRQLHAQVRDLVTRQELLPDTIITRLMETTAAVAPGLHNVTGCEPALPAADPAAAVAKQRRLSLRGLGTLLNVLPPQAISLEASAVALHSEEFYVRFAAAEILSRRGDREARHILQNVLSTGNAPQRASVAHHLHRFSWFTAEPMLRQALQDADIRVQESAVYSLCMLRGPDAYQLLLETLLRSDDRLRLAAAWGLNRDPDAGSVPVLAVLLQARDPEIRVKALELLGVTQAAAAVPSVLLALDDPDLDVQYAAALSWVELQGEACLPGLAQRIRESSGKVRAGFARALFHATNYLFMDVAHSTFADMVLDALETAMEDDWPEARLAASMPLAWIHHPRSTPVLQHAFDQESDVEVKSRMLMHAIHLMAPIGNALLAEALHSPDEPLRQVAEYLVKTYALKVGT